MTTDLKIKAEATDLIKKKKNEEYMSRIVCKTVLEDRILCVVLFSMIFFSRKIIGKTLV